MHHTGSFFILTLKLLQINCNESRTKCKGGDVEVTLDLSQVAPVIQRTAAVKEMLSVDDSGPRTKIRINASSLSVIQACPRKSWYLLERKLRSSTESPAILFGTAIHKALEVFYSEPPGNRSLPKGFKDSSNLMGFGESAPEEHFLYRAVEAFVKVAEPLRALPDSDKRSITGGIWLLQNYFDAYINDPYVVMSDAEGPITERTCSALLYEDREVEIEVFGTIDVVLRHQVTGDCLPADHKTSSVVGNDFYNRLKPNHQYSGYIWLAQKCLGIMSDQFLVNCLEVKAKPKTARGSGPHFPRQITKRTGEDLQEWSEVVVHAVKQYLGWRRANVWPLGSVDTCTFWGGCSFLEVCGAPQSLRENILSSKFISPEATHV